MSTWQVRCRSICDAEVGGAGKSDFLFVVKGEGASDSLSDFVLVTTRRGKGMGEDMGKDEGPGIPRRVTQFAGELSHVIGKIPPYIPLHIYVSSLPKATFLCGLR